MINRDVQAIFLSHSHADKAFVRRLARDLLNEGQKVWIDEAEIFVGDSLIEKISQAMDQIDFVAAIISKTSVKSEWVKRELDIAMNREIDEKRVVVLPILIDDVVLPVFLRGKLYADFRRPENYEEGLGLLLRSVSQHRSRTSSKSNVGKTESEQASEHITRRERPILGRPELSVPNVGNITMGDKINIHSGGDVVFAKDQGRANINKTASGNIINIEGIQSFTDNLKKYLDELGLEPDKRDDLETTVQAVEKEIQSPSPNAPKVNQYVATIKNILDGVAGSVIASGLLQMAQTLLR